MAPPPRRPLAASTTITRLHGRSGDRWPIVFLDQHGRPLYALTEWHRRRAEEGPLTTRETYLRWMLPVFSFFADRGVEWNDHPDRVRAGLAAFHRERLRCRVADDALEGVILTPTGHTPVSDSTLRGMRAALRDFYAIMLTAGLYGYGVNPLTSAVRQRLVDVRARAVAHAGAPDHAGIRGEPRPGRRPPTAFLRQPAAQPWRPDARLAASEVVAGIDRVLDAIQCDPAVAWRDKAILLLLRNTGARVGEVLGLTLAGWRAPGRAGEALLTSKGAAGRLVKRISWRGNPQVGEALRQYLERERPRADPAGRRPLVEVGDDEPFFVSRRGAAYQYHAFYAQWRRAYAPYAPLCRVGIGPHDLRHAFVTQLLAGLRLAYAAAPDEYRAAKVAVCRDIMGWRSLDTVERYDHSLDELAVWGQLHQLQRALAAGDAPTRDGVLAAAPPVGTSASGPAAQGVTPAEAGMAEPFAEVEAAVVAWRAELRHRPQPTDPGRRATEGGDA